MRGLIATLSVALLACSSETGEGAMLAEARATPAKAPTANPIVVELFQSQGCSSCPPANANVNRLAERRPDILALSFAVTYWDYLGWKDEFAQVAFTERQRAYARSKQSDGVYTPQVVINGRRALVGASAGSLAAAIRREGPLTGGPTIVRDGDFAVIGVGAAASPAKVLVVTYDPRSRNVPIRAGENGGKTLPHRNIVTTLVGAGTWSGRTVRIKLPVPADPALRTAVLVQRGEGGPLIAAAKL